MMTTIIRRDVALLRKLLDLFRSWFYKHLAPDGAKTFSEERLFCEQPCRV